MSKGITRSRKNLHDQRHHKVEKEPNITIVCSLVCNVHVSNTNMKKIGGPHTSIGFCFFNTFNYPKVDIALTPLYITS